MNGQLAILRCCFFLFTFFYIIPVISERWEEDNIKYKAVCNGTATWLVHVFHVSSEEQS